MAFEDATVDLGCVLTTKEWPIILASLKLVALHLDRNTQYSSMKIEVRDIKNLIAKLEASVIFINGGP